MLSDIAARYLRKYASKDKKVLLKKLDKVRLDEMAIGRVKLRNSMFWVLLE